MSFMRTKNATELGTKKGTGRQVVLQYIVFSFIVPLV
jgi:hypothetical protein